MAEPGAPPAGTQDRYRIERELGRGGMATVYLADDTRHGRKVALKFLSPELAASVGTERFLREVRLSASLHHPHILPVYDSGESVAANGETTLFYVMPYVEGETLRARIEREKQLPVDDTVRIASEVADALDYAHGRGVVHRDIKPENILLEGGHALVADFGIARPIGRTDTGTTLTQAGVAIGTPSYMSPEQATADRAIGPTSDVYSLGCVVYEMLAGQPPFTGPTADVVTRQHIAATPAPVTQYRPMVPERMEAVLKQALAKAPADRYRTAGEFAAALRQAAAAPTIVRAPTGLRAAAVNQRMRQIVAWTAVIAAALGVLIFARSRLRSPIQSRASGADAQRVAVLYFEDRSPDHGVEYLADGLTESLIHELSDVPGLQAISANGVAPFRGRHPPLDSIARALRVGTIVNGYIQAAGDKVRLTVSMTDASAGAEIGHSSFEVARNNALELQDSIARQVSFFLRRRIGRQVAEVRSRAGTKNSAAWDMVQLGDQAQREMDTLLTSGDTAAAVRRQQFADSLFAEAASIDPKWIDPIMRRGWLAFDSRHIYGLDKRAAGAWIARGLGRASDALALDPANAEALQLRGTLRYFQYLLNLDAHPLTSDQLLAGAERDLRAGTASNNARRAHAWTMLSHLLARTSTAAESRLAALRAYESDPFLDDASTIIWRLFTSAIDLADGAEASRWCAEGYRRFPTDPVFTECKIELLALQSRPEDISGAWEELRQNVALYPPPEREFRRRRGEMLVAIAAARAGLKDSARAIALRARTDDPRIDPTRDIVYFEVMLRNLLGDRDEALRRLALYVATNPEERSNIAKDQTWWFDGLRDDPRFKELVQTK
jgi:serine/threonine-protein kinase